MNTLDILATLIAQVFLFKMGLSTYHLAAVVPLVAAMLGYLTTNPGLMDWVKTGITNPERIFGEWTENVPSTVALGWCAIIACIGWLVIKWWRYQFIILEINKTALTNKIITYITLNKEKFNKFPSMLNGDANMLVYNSLEITNEFSDNYLKPGQIIYFWNTLFGTGYMTTHLRFINCDKQQQQQVYRDNDNDTTGVYGSAARHTSVSIPIYSCRLHIIKSSTNPSMLENLDTILDNNNFERNREAPHLKLINYKIHTAQNSKKKLIPISIVEYTIYQGRNRTLAELEPIYMDTHFHSEKDRLWSLIKEIDQNKDYFQKYGQTPKLNLLLHGPPGTGKSSFAYRVAMTLRRDIISMDLTKYPNRYVIDKLMHGYINVCLTNGFMINPSRLVYVFDEFDRTIEFLIAAQDKEKRVFESKLKAMSAGNGLAALLGANSGKSKSGGRKSQESGDSDEDDGNITAEFDSSPTDPSTASLASQLLTIKDLLEIFQGVVDVNGRLIFAMTNHFDKIKVECPALFRPGRLTPVYFGYINRETLCEIVEYYFKQPLSDADLDLLPGEFQIPTSEIIEQAIYFSTQKNGYNSFIKWLISRCQ